MLLSPRRFWLLLTLFVASGIAGVSYQGYATSHAHHSSKLGNIALSREDRSQVLFSAGIQKAIQGNYMQAIEAYDQALQLSPSNSEVYYNRGVAYFSINRPQDAFQDFSKAITLQPKMAEAYGNRGLIRQTMGDRQGALADYNQAKQLFQQKGDLPAAQQMEQWINQHSIPQ